MKRFHAILVLCTVTAVTTAAATPPATEAGPTVTLQASASAEVPRDLIAVTFSATREGADPAAVQAGLKQALDAALAQARQVARPGQVDVKAGHFGVHPRHTPRGQLAGWVGTAEMTVEGRDLAAIAQLTARVQTMTIARVGYALSREARAQVEGQVTAQAIAQFRARAAEISQEFGFTGYRLREVRVGTDTPLPPPMPLQERMMAAAAREDALPVEPGRAVVSATVSGSVQLQ